MRIPKNDIPVRIAVPGATARQVYDFGDATAYGKLAGEYFSLKAATDFAPLLKGLEDDLCQCPHWGYVMEGEIQITYTNGDIETVSGGDLFYWPPGHTVLITQDTEMIMFSPQAEHCAVVDHIQEQLAAV
jgi:hypothetical protein